MATVTLNASWFHSARAAGLRAPWWGEYLRPHRAFGVETADGVALRGVHLCEPGARPSRKSTLLIYCHGFLSSKSYLPIRRFLETLTDELDVIAFDFRGHGESDGATTLGEREVLDLDAVIQYARRFDYARVVVMGSSMGGAVAIRYAAESPAVDGVITLGAFAHPQFARLARAGLALLRVPFSRRILYLSLATRVQSATPPYSPCEYVARISPRPLLLLHGARDPLIPLAHARDLYARAMAPKELFVIPGGSHDTENLNGRTRTRILEWMRRTG